MKYFVALEIRSSRFAIDFIDDGAVT